MRLSVLGGGFMGAAIVEQVIERGLATAEGVQVCEINPRRRDELAQQYGVRTSDAFDASGEPPDVVVVAVKPQDFAKAAGELHAHLHPQQLVVSIMAGVPLQRLGDTLQRHHVVRVMPNLPATVGEGFSIWTATEEVSDDQRGLVRALLGSLGREVFVEDEKLIDIATAVSGSGPGYVMLLLEALIDGAVYLGLRRDVATEMVMQTVLGSVRWAQAAGEHPAVLRGQVASPGGTTVEGLLALEKSGVRAALIDAVIAGYQKSRALGG